MVTVFGQPFAVEVSCLLDEVHNPSRCFVARTARSLSRIDITDLVAGVIASIMVNMVASAALVKLDADPWSLLSTQRLIFEVARCAHASIVVQ
jgi:hypothetical protein